MKNLLLVIAFLFTSASHAQFALHFDSTGLYVNGNHVPNKLDAKRVKQIAGQYTSSYTLGEMDWENGLRDRDLKVCFNYKPNGFSIGYRKKYFDFGVVFLSIHRYSDKKNKTEGVIFDNSVTVDDFRMDTSSNYDQVKQGLAKHLLVYDDEYNLFKQVYAPILYYAIYGHIVKFYFLPRSNKLSFIKVYRK
ncbi:MAG: hypothetical protein K2Y12_09235 [Chitinophagaceae bacterium]|nr:hypothetical protein [Chitinophagaceae bacterium]